MLDLTPTSPLLAPTRVEAEPPPPQWRKLGLLALAAALPLLLLALILGLLPAPGFLGDVRVALHDWLWLPAVGWLWTAIHPYGWVWLLGMLGVAVLLVCVWIGVRLRGAALLDRPTAWALERPQLGAALLRFAQKTGAGRFAPLHLGAVAASRHAHWAVQLRSDNAAALGPTQRAAAQEAALLAAMPQLLQADPEALLRTVDTALLLRAKGGDAGGLWQVVAPSFRATEAQAEAEGLGLWQDALVEVLDALFGPAPQPVLAELPARLLAETIRQLGQAGDVRAAPLRAAELRAAPRLAAALTLLTGRGAYAAALLEAFQFARLAGDHAATAPAVPAMQQLAVLLTGAVATPGDRQDGAALQRMAGREAQHA